jgi:hypothetical protein
MESEPERCGAALANPTGGTIYVGGDFTWIGGQLRTRLAELDVNTGNATAMNVAMNSSVRALEIPVRSCTSAATSRLLRPHEAGCARST